MCTPKAFFFGPTLGLLYKISSKALSLLSFLPAYGDTPMPIWENFRAIYRRNADVRIAANKLSSGADCYTKTGGAVGYRVSDLHAWMSLNRVKHTSEWSEQRYKLSIAKL
jgi:hypothetical protein